MHLTPICQYLYIWTDKRNECIKQQIYLIKSNKLQIIKYN